MWPCFAWILHMFINNNESLCSVLHFTKLLYMHFIEGGLQNSCLCSKTLSRESQCVWREGSGCREPLCAATGPPSAPAESCRISFLFQGKQKWFPVSRTFHSGACLGTGNLCLCFVHFSWGKWEWTVPAILKVKSYESPGLSCVIALLSHSQAGEDASLFSSELRRWVEQ